MGLNSQHHKVSHIWASAVRAPEDFTGWGAEQAERNKVSQDGGFNSQSAVSHNWDSGQSGKRFHKMGQSSQSSRRFRTMGVEQSERQKVSHNRG